jgi:hypothetical protein
MLHRLSIPLALVILLLLNFAGRSRAAEASAPVDEIILGESGAEQAHALAADQSDIINGGLDQSARRLLPQSPATTDGGSVSFTMKVDPQEQNYVTAKFWGSDKGQEMGRLILYANGLQVGYRHEGDYDVLNQSDSEGEAPGRFFYETVPLPLSLTRGKSTVALKVAVIGPMWAYGASFDQYQKKLTAPSRGIYRIYTHTSARFVPDATEKQGQLPAVAVRSGPGEEVISQSKQIVIDRLARLIARPIRGEKNQKAREGRLDLLADAYNTPWTPAYHSAAAIEQIVADGDAMADNFATDQKAVTQTWLGAGPLGEAVLRTWPKIGERLDESVTVGGNSITRRQLWSGILHESVDYWRTHRRSYTNQSMIVDRNIYTANRALALIDPSRALPEAKALDYLYQAVGIEPWLGSDPRPDATDLPDAPGKGEPKPFGEHYALVTRKGLSRELGWVGTYGETILRFMRDMVQLTGDEKIRQQLAKIEHARLYFRYPGVDGDGFRCMKLVSEVDNRTAHYPLEGGAYNSPSIRESWWMDVAATLSDDPVVVGVAQQAMEDNQYFAYVQSRLKDPDTQGMMLNVDQYAKVKSLPPSSVRLPMTDGQPDFAFADEEDAIIAIKHGDTRLFVNLYYRAERGVNSVARIYEQTPTITRIATVRTQTQVDSSGQTYIRPDWIDAMRGRGFPPPGQEIHQAWAGEQLPISARPADAPMPAYGDWGPFLGKAAFYELRDGDYLIAMNSSEAKEFPLRVPPEFAHARDLISGKSAEELGGRSVPRLSTVVLFEPDNP